jgi:quinol monooxygenase YgiN
MARITAKPGAEVPLGDILSTLAAASRREPGCLSYDLFHDEEEPALFVTVERWADPAVADEHMRTPHVATALAEGGPLLAETPQIHRFKQIV